jgi:NADPH2:quinone reductase
MKTIRVKAFGGPEVLELAQLPDLHPGPGQVLVRLAAAGVNPVETYIRSGQYPRLPELPYTPGGDGAGVIFRTGPGVPASLSAGQRVWLSGSVSGTYAEAALCEAGQVHPLPDRVTFAQGAALGVPYPTAYRALFPRGGARPGETVLIHGATGGTGLAAVQLARMFGLRVLATGGSDAGRQMLATQGAEVFDHTSATLPEDIAKKTGGVNLIVEMLANANLARDLTMLAKGGRVAVVGSRGPVEINPRDAMMREADIRGVMLFSATPAESAEAWAAIDAGLESGALAPLIGEEIPLAEAPRAHAAVMGRGHVGKVVLACGGV